MKIIKLTRPALDPRRHLELQMREARAGLSDFVQSVAEPVSGWLEVELLPDEPAVDEARPRRAGRTG
jgi:hypothetical protein